MANTPTLMKQEHLFTLQKYKLKIKYIAYDSYYK